MAAPATTGGDVYCWLSLPTAGHIAALLESQGIELEIVWDEGVGISLDGLPPFTRQPLAFVGTAEKSYQSLQVGQNALFILCAIRIHGQVTCR
jgi:hypothetical protein